jgi:hypothetical protein
MAAKAVGADEYAAKQMGEYQATQQEIADKYAARVPSYKDVQSVGDALTYVTESVGELLPSMIPSLLTGGVGGVALRGTTVAAQKAAQQAAKEVAEREVARAASKNVLTAETLKQIEKTAIDAGVKKATEIAAKATAKGQAIGAGVGSAAQNIPEVYTNVYDAVEGQVGGKELATAVAFGTFNAALDSILPASILQKITKSGLPKEEVAAAWLKRGAKGLATGFVKEGATESIQEMSSAAAEKFVNENKNFFTEENFERFVNAGLKGGIGGGVSTGVADIATGKGPDKVDKKAQEAIEKTLVDQKVIEEEQAETTAETGLEDVSDLDKIIDDLNKPQVSDEATPPASLADLPIKDIPAPPAAVNKVYDLTPEAFNLLRIAETGGIPSGFSDKQLKAIAKQNELEFNPAVDTVEDLITRLKDKLGEQDAGRRDAETSGAGIDVSGEQRRDDTVGAEELDRPGVDGDESSVITDKDTAGDEQLTLEEQAALQAELDQELGNQEVIEPPVDEVVAKEKSPQAELAVEEAQAPVVEEKVPGGSFSMTGKLGIQTAQNYRKQQAEIAKEIDADNTLTKEEKESATAFNNYMVVSNNNIKRALDLLSADLFAGGANNPYMPNTGGVNAKRFYDGLNPSNKKIVDERLTFLKAQEKRINALAEKAETREAANLAEDNETALLRRTQIFGHSTKTLISKVFLGDTVGALQEIAQGEGFSQLDRMIAKRILESKTFPEIEIVPAETLVDEQGRQASGQYVTQSDTAQIADGQVDSHSVLHEVSHGYLHALIRGFQAGEIQNKGLTQLNELYTFLKDNNPELADQYGMGDLSEFASEVMSNPDFQLQLSKIPYQRVNAFTAFAQAVLRVMGIDPNEKATALAAGLIAIDKSLATGRLYQDNEVTGKVVMPSPKVIREGEESDVEGLEGVARGTKKVPREEQSYEDALAPLEKDIESFKACQVYFQPKI